MELSPCDLLFVHRDADRGPRSDRLNEISDAIARLGQRMVVPPVISVVPIRMTEAWLLTDEAAIRRAAGNPNGRNSLNVPRIQDIEGIPNPKQVLRDLLIEASELTGRRRKDFRADPYRVADLTSDLSPLRLLSAFQALDNDIQRVVAVIGHG